VTEYRITLPFAFVYAPGTPASQAVQVGLQAMITAVLQTSPVATGPHERAMALAALIGVELATVPADQRDQAEAMITSAMRGAARGTEAARFAASAPAGRA
jgi:hypothetical protein